MVVAGSWERARTEEARADMDYHPLIVLVRE
jgi:hypothetical protein